MCEREDKESGIDPVYRTYTALISRCTAGIQTFKHFLCICILQTLILHFDLHLLSVMGISRDENQPHSFHLVPSSFTSSSGETGPGGVQFLLFGKSDERKRTIMFFYVVIVIHQ